jgi:diacylglycerol kinase family enzyme
METKACLIFNPVAGQGNPEEDLALIESLLQPEITLEVVMTTAETDIGELAKAAIERGSESIIASGGDGTLSAVATALMGSNIPLGVISRGTANAFANALKLPTTIPTACEAILVGATPIRFG